MGAVGPGARAAGLAQDLRANSPLLSYEGFSAAVPERAAGDVQARLEQRALELWQTFALLDRLLDDPIRPASAEPGGRERPIGVGRVESPRGATSCVVERRGDRIERLRLRTGSYANWPIVAFAATDNLLPDFPLINKSFELCYACVDR
jgi:Ni,Fe-hydrogenase III large subunit